ncbi:Re/Si-specific NAD(P)(+) transhydrogenase subunit alpha [bacterium]|nr:Re/Si-specific NAD(P)(+) transhydrogenase subunit alpha [bacterium]
MPTVLVPKEIVPGETRVAATPETVRRFAKMGFTVLVEKDAGAGSFFADESYAQAGAEIVPDVVEAYKRADLVLKLHPPRFHEERKGFEADFLREGTILVSFLYPTQNADTVEALTKRKISAFAMDQIPRITRAQKHDALSSQANLAGYKAVIMAAERMPKIFPLLMTAAGTITPAKVVILGAGVAGLQAIATAKRLGAIVDVSDVRPAVKEQVQSLGGRFIEVPTDESMQTAGGYAKEQSAEFLAKQQALVRKFIVEADAVITTALIPGRPAPKLIPADMVKDMKNGAVIVDLAAEQGGNCELTEPGQTVVKEGVTIMGVPNIPATVPVNASDMYAKNVLYVVEALYPKGELNFNFEDEILAGAIVTHDGAVRDRTAK